MALTRFTRPVDGTIPIPALLYNDEQLFASQDGVGLYDGPNKSPAHQSGTLHITSHRLFFIAGATSSSPLDVPAFESEGGASLFLPLEVVSHTESYAGFFTSSAKVTLYLRDPEEQVHSPTQERASEPSELAQPEPIVGVGTTPGSTRGPIVAGESSHVASTKSRANTNQTDGAFDVWECEICGEKNAPGLSPAARKTCGLCGMPRAVSSSATPSSSTPQPIPAIVADPPSGIVGNQFAPEKPSSLSYASYAHLHSRSSANTPAPAPSSGSPSNLANEEGASSPNTKGRRKPSSVPCSVCTFLNHPYLRECEMCGTPLSRPVESSSSQGGSGLTQALKPSSKSAPVSRPGSPSKGTPSPSSAPLDPREAYIRLSFRKGGDKTFYAALKTALQQKAVETREQKSKLNVDVGPANDTKLLGIGGILDKIDLNNVRAETGMNDAFEDLEALMSKAQAMVKLAKDLNEQLTAAQKASNDEHSLELLEPEEATFVRSSLGQLGLSMKNAAVTADMSGDEKKYLEQLAHELAGILEGHIEPGQNPNMNEKEREVGIMRRRGIVGLDEVWGGWNRARGVALISPEITLKVLPFLPQYTVPPIKTRELSSGLRVLHTPAYSTSAFSSRLVGNMIEEGSKTTTDIAYAERLPVGLVEELVNEAEERGDITRDDPLSWTSDAGVGVEIRWWLNAFTGYTWDGEEIDRINSI